MSAVATAFAYPSLAERLPGVRGKLAENASLAPFTWFRAGGPAQALFLPADEADLALFLAQTPEDIPVTVLGAASNVIIRDGGVQGVVVRLTRPFADIAVGADAVVRAGAGALDKAVAKAAASAGVGGLEFLAGVPGTIGGALRMNAGCYDAETKDVLVRAFALDRLGRRLCVEPSELGYGYRRSAAAADWIFVEAELRGQPCDPAEAEARIAEITARREASQPIRDKTGGSTFKNPDPPGTPDQRRAWALIDAAGCRGLKVGGAQMSEKHCNFMINTGDASAADLEALGEEVRRRVAETSGVTLEWEIKRLGLTLEAARAAADAAT